MTKDKGNPKESATTKAAPGLMVERRTNESESAALARAALNPIVQAALTTEAYNRSLPAVEDLNAVVAELETQARAVNSGSLLQGETMLTAQAHSLDAVYNELVRRAKRAELLPQLETYLKYALRAQAQCRATWEAISAIKNPSSMIVTRQANIANGPQQVNNAPSRAGENENCQNRLLEAQHGERLDAGAQGATSRANPQMETVGAVHRTENPRR